MLEANRNWSLKLIQKPYLTPIGNTNFAQLAASRLQKMQARE